MFVVIVFCFVLLCFVLIVIVNARAHRKCGNRGFFGSTDQNPWIESRGPWIESRGSGFLLANLVKNAMMVKTEGRRILICI